VHNLKSKNEQGVEEIKTIDLSQPLKITFKGYYGFLTEEDKKGSKEGKETFGLTKNSRTSTINNGKVGDDGKPIPPIAQDFFMIECFNDNRREMEIGLEKKLFLNRLGYEE
jgi:hypothetical protein